ncbi:hypothetical protein DAPPUDRAFT_115785 [Daphnia pulex]|uniref:Uncharacterized protein n=1 Tax=Daphnia pulex TaxID=6669 RepID=E9HMI5_DAPPU|nr:hypothetical protein DAPPUDRAFT_115785 [Daphnia pulex]|eukprot:EFX67048.1 hypothetical protein DAPPUDRAFT_115785 [Daphnia pulex]
MSKKRNAQEYALKEYSSTCFLPKGTNPLQNFQVKSLKHMSLIQMREILQVVAPFEGQSAPVPAVHPVLNDEAIKDWKKKDSLLIIITIEQKLSNTLNGAGTHQNKGHRGRGGFDNRGSFSGPSTGARAPEGPAAKKPRYGGTPCGFCTINGHNGEAIYQTIGCRKRAETERTRQVAMNAVFTNSPTVDFGKPASSGSLTRIKATVWNADSGSTSHLTDQKQFLRNFVAITPFSRIIKGNGNATAVVQGYGDVIIYYFVNVWVFGHLLSRSSRGRDTKSSSSELDVRRTQDYYVQQKLIYYGKYKLLKLDGWKNKIYPTDPDSEKIAHVQAIEMSALKDIVFLRKPHRLPQCQNFRFP